MIKPAGFLQPALHSPWSMGVGVEVCLFCCVGDSFFLLRFPPFPSLIYLPVGFFVIGIPTEIMAPFLFVQLDVLGSPSDLGARRKAASKC